MVLGKMYMLFPASSESSNNSTPMYMPQRMENRCSDKHTHTNTHIFIATLFTIVKMWKQPEFLSVGEWANK